MKTITRKDLSAKLGAFVSVKNGASRSGYNVPNQFIIKFENGEAFQSYESLIGVKIGRQLYLTDNHDYSHTTSRYCGQWCMLNCAERRKGLKDGTIIMID